MGLVELSINGREGEISRKIVDAAYDFFTGRMDDQAEILISLADLTSLTSIMPDRDYTTVEMIITPYGELIVQYWAQNGFTIFPLFESFIEEHGEAIDIMLRIEKITKTQRVQNGLKTGDS